MILEYYRLFSAVFGGIFVFPGGKSAIFQEIFNNFTTNVKKLLTNFFA